MTAGRSTRNGGSAMASSRATPSMKKMAGASASHSQRRARGIGIANTAPTKRGSTGGKRHSGVTRKAPRAVQSVGPRADAAVPNAVSTAPTVDAVHAPTRVSHALVNAHGAEAAYTTSPADAIRQNRTHAAL